MAALTSAGLERDAIFYRDLHLLLGPGRRLEFWPSAEMATEEKINATVRFLLYAGALLYVLTFKAKYVAMSWTAILLLGLVYANAPPNQREGFQGAPVRQEAARKRTRDNPFANPLHADGSDDAQLPAPDWTAQEAATASKLFRSRMYMDVADVASLQSTERQFMQMPTQDVDAFLRFLAQKP